jgi:hypothetical protein
MGIDRDGDAFFDRDELDAGTDPTVPDRIPGGGQSTTDCIAEWTVRNPPNTPFLDPRGHPHRRQACTDGDTLCDADGAVNGECVFEVGVCFNVLDPRSSPPAPGCVPSDVRTVQLRRPHTGSPRPLEAANAAALRDAVVHVRPDSMGTATGDTVTFAAPLVERNLCTAPASISVPAGAQRTRLGIRSTTSPQPGQSAGRRDIDDLSLRCLPAVATALSVFPRPRSVRTARIAALPASLK